MGQELEHAVGTPLAKRQQAFGQYNRKQGGGCCCDLHTQLKKLQINRTFKHGSVVAAQLQKLIRV